MSEIGEIPSFRRTRLEALSARDGRLRTRLRESNTLSSSLYRGDGEGSSIRYTNARGGIRPRRWALRSRERQSTAFNLLTGIGQMAWGLVKAPFDGGAELTAGAEGVVFSVPELAFVNLRKGSMAYAPSERPRTTLRVLETP